jgi:glycosyltransferase involved in cell wall biosynthesis
MGCFDIPKRAIRQVRAQLGRLAPPGTWRRAALGQFYALFNTRRYWPPRPVYVKPLSVPFERETLNRFLKPFGIHLSRRLGPVTPETAARRVLELLLAHPELHTRFPRALRDGERGAFAQWLVSRAAKRHGIDAAAARLMVAELTRGPGQNVLHFYDHEPHSRKLFPLALTPADLPAFMHWLLTHRDSLKLAADDILWFALEATEDPAYGLAATFLRRPEWQEAVPHGLTRFGWDELKRWAADRHDLSGDWLARARRPDTLRPVEELHWLTVARPDLARRFPGVLTDPAAAQALARHLRAERVGGNFDWVGWLKSDPVGCRPGANVLAHFRYPSGLQVAAENTAAALESAGLVASRRDVPTGVQRDLRGRYGFIDLHPYPVTISQLAPEPLAEDCYPLAGLAMRLDTYRIGYWYWELEEVPAAWTRHAQWLHELWAPTRFIGDALRRVMPLPVVDMLAGARMPPVVHRPRSQFGLPDDRFLFLFVFDMCSTFERKNPLGVVEAFRRAFTPRDPVALAVKVSRGFHDPYGLRALTDACARAGAHLIDAMLPADDLFGLMNCCDAYVSLHRSEGYGLTMAEAMALGKPVIATGYSGNLDFMTTANSLLVSHTMVPLQATVHVYRKGCLWAEPSVDHAAELMRWVVEHRAEARAMGERAGRDVRETLSLEAAGRRMARRLAELAAGRPLRAAG